MDASVMIAASVKIQKAETAFRTASSGFWSLAGLLPALVGV
jgi:hypothetical protein